MKQHLHALYGLKWDPFSPDIPTESLYQSKAVESFIWRIEQHHIHEGGFAMIVGDPGTGKSCLLRLIAQKLEQIQGLKVQTFTHPQSTVRDFYHELGDLFEIPIQAHNRWHSFKSLRQKWQQHLENQAIKPILLIDEAQEMQTSVMNELRLLNSHHYDSRNLITVIFAGNMALQARFRTVTSLLPLGSRIRKRIQMAHQSSDELLACLNHQLEQAGNTLLMTDTLKQTLCDHALGNHRMLNVMSHELLEVACRKKQKQLDEQLYFEVFAKTPLTNKGGEQ